MGRTVRRPASPVLPVVLIAAVALALGFAIKVAVDPRSSGAATYPTLGYSDVRGLYTGRHIPDGLLYVDHDFEYPVLTGAFAEGAEVVRSVLDSVALAGSGREAYFAVSALLLAPFGLAVAWMLARACGWRALVWAATPPLVAYAFLNWDLLAAAAAVAALLVAGRGRGGAAGALLGVGAAAKLFPALLLVPVVHRRVSTGDRRGAVREAVAFGGVTALLNLPVLLAAPGGWRRIWTFHSGRNPDKGTWWFWLHRDGGETFRRVVDGAGIVILVVAAFVLLRRAGRAAAVTGSYPLAATCAGIVAALLAVSKVHSPQYALWIVPLLVLAAVPLPLVAAYLTADLAVIVVAFVWTSVASGAPPDGVYAAVAVARAGVLAAIAAWAAIAIGRYSSTVAYASAHSRS